MQDGPFDCGIACLKSIVNYTGALMPDCLENKYTTITGYGISLYDLKDLAISCGLPAVCVEMDLSYLLTVETPCILHITEVPDLDHYIIYYGSKFVKHKRLILIGDPAEGLKYLTESELDRLWKSKAALHFSALTPSIRKDSANKNSILIVFEQPAILIIPLLGLGIGAFGIMASLFIQQTFDSSVLGRNIAMPRSGLLILLTVMLIRTSLIFFRQKLLISFTWEIGKILFKKTVQTIWSHPYINHVEEFFIRVQKIQNAFNEFIVRILTDGLILLLILLAQFYWMPLIGVMNIIFLTIMCYLAYRDLDNMNNQVKRVEQHLKLATGKTNYLLRLPDMRTSGVRGTRYKFRIWRYILNYQQTIKQVTNQLNRRTLLFQLHSNLLVFIVLVYTVRLMSKSEEQHWIYLSMNFLTIMVTMLISKILQAMQLVLTGLEELKRILSPTEKF
ncbi:hypothetical protein GCM10023149_37700 [Mucilaginibacter gynuensis]|uniref:Peptidase C39 domain-containing protein n=2 Tax=Mucilaginibacter gynuensis TaxID=1302236 RepID=A0ABP8GZ68_9SPHI